MAKFEKNVHKVDLGDDYLTRIAAKEMVICLSQCVINKRLVEPSNNNTIHYNYGIMNDGSSSAKTVDERELFLIKTVEAGLPRYSVLSLAEVAEATAEGVNGSLKSSFE